MRLGSLKVLLYTSSAFDVDGGDTSREHAHGSQYASSVQAHMIQGHVQQTTQPVETVGRNTERGKGNRARYFSVIGRQLHREG